MSCDSCGGALNYVGTLGRKRWFRCRMCGLDQYEEGYFDEEEEADDNEYD